MQGADFTGNLFYYLQHKKGSIYDKQEKDNVLQAVKQRLLTLFKANVCKMLSSHFLV